ncbi:MAG: sarcosine oxidase subunit gamma [Geminicoccaceae bacterium]
MADPEIAFDGLVAHAAVSNRSVPRGVRLSERRGLGKIDLRGNPGDRGFMSAVGRSLDLLLPTEPCTSASQGDVSALWLGPDQWLIICQEDRTAALITELDEALGSIHAATTDVSAGRCSFRLRGPDVLDVLAKGCPLDLDPRSVKPGYVAGSVLAKITALVHLSEDGVVDLYAGRSFADYLWAWLENAGLEYGLIID